MKKFLFAPLALALVAAPAISAERANQPVNGEEVAGTSGVLIAVLAAAAVIGGIVAIADDDDDSQLPISD